MIAIGLMSGTSLDGVDAALIEICPKGKGYRINLNAFSTTPYPADLAGDLHAILPPHAGNVQGLAGLHRRLGEVYAQAAAGVAGAAKVDYAAMHGQTIYHDGPNGITLQIGSPYFLRECLRATVVHDFRSADCALGGHGAPLVPYFDALQLCSEDEDRVVANIGGIANLTYLPRAGAPQEAVAFDSGPGNMLIDAFVQMRSNGALAFDENGALALRGTVHESVLNVLLGDPYFAVPHPKSTGREYFGTQFLDAHAALFSPLSLEDGAATLTALSARTLGAAICSLAPKGARVFVSGGGTHNRAMQRMLAECLQGYALEATTGLNLSPDAKEAIAFAVLGYETLRGRPANLPRVTGARSATVLGSIVPERLDALLAMVHKECVE